MLSFFKKVNHNIGKCFYETQNKAINGAYVANFKSGERFIINGAYVDGKFNPEQAFYIGMQKIISIT